MAEKVAVTRIINGLSKLYPNPQPSLDFKNPFELLVATILAAQCTDVRVNKITPALFRAASSPEKMIALGGKKLEGYIRSTGFFRAKAKSLMGACRALKEKFNGKIPSSLEELTALPGVGRKTASVVLSQAFDIPAFPVDRHVLRVANRLGLAASKTPDETDLQLRAAIPKHFWIRLHMQLVAHGRQICRPNPKCGACALLSDCPEGKRRIKSRKSNQN